MLNEDLSIKYLIREPQLKKSKSPLLILLHGFVKRFQVQIITQVIIKMQLLMLIKKYPS